jgi:Uma2 family endonuclease
MNTLSLSLKWFVIDFYTEASIAVILSGEKLLRLNMPAPLLVIEIISSGNLGSRNYDRDYVEKPREYAARGIIEFGSAIEVMIHCSGG